MKLEKLLYPEDSRYKQSSIAAFFSIGSIVWKYEKLHAIYWR